MIRVQTILKCGVAGAAALALIGTASAKDEKPINAAETASGTGCLVRDANGDYHVDPDCKWKTVVKRDKDGNLVSYKYQDKGTLPDGAPAPSSAMSWDDAPCGDDVYDEQTTPSGQYSSSCHFEP